jgi:hypothetical protein
VVLGAGHEAAMDQAGGGVTNDRRRRRADHGRTIWSSPCVSKTAAPNRTTAPGGDSLEAPPDAAA